VLSRETGLHPILNIFALMVGGSLFGFMGLVFAVPVAASIKEVLIYFYPRLAEELPETTRHRRKAKKKREAEAMGSPPAEMDPLATPSPD